MRRGFLVPLAAYVTDNELEDASFLCENEEWPAHADPHFGATIQKRELSCMCPQTRGEIRPHRSLPEPLGDQQREYRPPGKDIAEMEAPGNEAGDAQLRESIQLSAGDELPGEDLTGLGGLDSEAPGHFCAASPHAFDPHPLTRDQAARSLTLSAVPGSQALTWSDSSSGSSK